MVHAERSTQLALNLQQWFDLALRFLSQAAFILLTTLPASPPWHVFLPELFEHKELYDLAKQGVDLRAMTEEELREAIQEPLRQARPAGDRRFEPALLERLAHDAAGDAAYLPLLQVTPEDLWRRGSLTLAAYGSLTDAIRQRHSARDP